MPRQFEVSAVLRFVDRVTRPVRRASNAVRSFTRRATRNLKQVNRIGKKVSATIGRGVARGFQLASAAVVGFGLAAKKVIEVGAGFEKKLVSAAVKFPGKIRPGTKAFEQLEAAAQKTGSTTEFTATQSAEALEFLALAGFKAKEAIASLPGVVDLATVANVELGIASDIATDTLGAMALRGKTAAETQKNLARVTDVYAVAQSSANNSVEQLFGALRKFGQVAAKTNTEIETAATLVGTLADAGIKGEEAGVALRNMFLRLVAPVGKAKGLIKKYIGDLDDGSGGMIDFVEIAGRLDKSLGGLGSLKAAPILKEIFNVRTIGPVLTLLEKGSADLTTFRKKLQSSQGAASEMAGVMRNTTAGSIDALKSSIEGAVISMFKLEKGPIKGIIDGMVKWVRENEKIITSGIGDFIKGVTENFDKIVNTIKAIGTVIAVVWGLSKAIAAVNAILLITNLIMAANPITLIIMGIVAAVAIAAGLIVYYWDDIKAAWGVVVQFFSNLWDGITQVFSDAVNRLIWSGPISWFIAAAGLVLKFWKWILPHLKGIWTEAVLIFENAIGYIVNSGPVQWLLKAVDWVIEAWEKVKTFFKDFWKEVELIFEGAVNRVKDFLSPVTDLIDRFVQAKDNLIGDTFGIGEDGEDGQSAASMASVISPEERAARSERSETKVSRSEVTIRDETGRAEVTEGDLGMGVSLMPTGTF